MNICTVFLETPLRTKMRVVIYLTFLTTALVAADDLDWARTALIYQIYPRSFKDSNGDGIGDLNGITSKLDYLAELGVDAIWLSPMFLSPMYDFGYDITDYRQVAPEYGTMQDFDNLLSEAKKRGVKVVLDLVPNHTSNESDWFLKSARREPGFENYYVWADGDNSTGVMKPPSNWVCNFRKTAWEWNPTRGQYYFHQFHIAQPDLNYREPKVQQEMKDVIRFWLDKGVSGFRVDAINHMYEVDPKDFGGKYPDEPRSGLPGLDPDDYDYLSHIYTRDLDETYDVVYDWRDVLTEYIGKQGEFKLMMTEAYAELEQMIRYYGSGNRSGSMPMNFRFLGDIHNTSNARDIKLVIDKWMTYMPSKEPANWVNGNHDQSRMASRHGTDRVDAMNLLAQILPGVTLTYQGEEIGQLDGFVSWEDTKDPPACNTEDPINYWKKSRDPNRTPYQWDDSKHAGFSTANGSTWLPVADTYKTINLAAQQKATKSHFKFYKDVVSEVKKTEAVRHGDLDTRTLNENLLVVTRLLPGSPGIVGIVNLSNQDQTVDLSSLRLVPNQLEVVASGVDCKLEKGTKVTKSSIQVSAHCAIALKSTTNCC
ncbi:hypothetical protein O0L34_g18681 [Tuta absoluta]|nr:hypothetical protein O0L34_g18681 [Tuta absoluta]